MSLFPINMEVKTPEESISGSFSDDGKVNAQPIYVKKELQEVLRELKQNWSVHYYSKGAWSMHEMLEYLLQITGPADVSLTGSGLCDVVAFKARHFIKPPKLIRCTQLNFCTSATI